MARNTEQKPIMRQINMYPATSAHAERKNKLNQYPGH
jgi:hypothetical protein